MTEPTPPEQYQVVDRNTTGPRAVFVNLDAIRLREVEAERDLLLAQNTTLLAEVERLSTDRLKMIEDYEGIVRFTRGERDGAWDQNATLREQVTAYREGEARLLARIEKLETKGGEK